MPRNAAAPVPTFTGDRFLLLQPLITPRAIELARERVRNHKARIVKKAGDTPEDIAEKRVALLLYIEMCPLGFRTNQEDALLRGLDKDTVSKVKKEQRP